MRVQPWLPVVVFRASSTPAPYMPPALEPPSSQLCLCNSYTPQPSPGQWWYCVSAIRNAVYPHSGRKCHNSGHRYLGPPSIAALAPPTLAAIDLPRNGTIQCTTALTRTTYTGLLRDPRARGAFLNNSPLTMTHIPTIHIAQPTVETHQVRRGKAGDDWIGQGQRPQW